MLILTRSQIAGLLSFDEYVQVVEDAFRAHAEGRSLQPALMHVAAPDGEFHIKAGGLLTPEPYFALKANGGFFKNRERFNLPNIQGMVILASAETGKPLAVMDSMELTIQRTGAATAIAARYLARPESQVAMIFGCGTQGRVQLAALRHQLDIRRVFVHDTDAAAAQAFASEIARDRLDVDVPVRPKLAARASDVIVTCTSARTPFLRPDDVRAGTFIAAIGADNPEKNEIEPSLMAKARVVTDLTEQCNHMGDLHHAIRAGTMQAADVHAELGELVAGRKPGRMAAHEITLFDGTGVGIQDVAAAACAFRRARLAESGSILRLQ